MLAPHSLHGISKTRNTVGAKIESREPLLILDQPATHTAEANRPPNGASLIVERLLHWPNAAPLLRAAMVAIFALAVGVVLSHFGQIGRQAALPSATHSRAANEQALRTAYL